MAHSRLSQASNDPSAWKVRQKTAEAIHQTMKPFDPRNGPPKPSSIRSPPQNPRPSIDPLDHGVSHLPNGYDDDAEWQGDWVSSEEEDDKTALLPKSSRRPRDVKASVIAPRENLAQVRSNFSTSTISQSAAPTSVEQMSREKLVASVYHLQNEVRLVKHKLAEAEQNVGLAHSKRDYSLDDRYFTDFVSRLRSDIEGWTLKYFNHESNYAARRARHQFQYIAGDWDRYLRLKNYRPWLIEARLWDLLRRNVFEDSRKHIGFIWAGGTGTRRFFRSERGRVWRDLQPLENMLNPGLSAAMPVAIKEFHEWRALTYNLLFPGIGKDVELKVGRDDIEKQVERVTHIIWKSLRAYAIKDWGHRGPSPAELDLREIVVDAMSLDLDFRKQVADFKFPCWRDEDRKGGMRTEQFGFEYNDEEMVAVNDWSTKDYVDMVVSPALYKRGNSSGTGFNKQVPLVRANVLCNRNPQRSSVPIKKAVSSIFSTSKTKPKPKRSSSKRRR